SQRGPLLIVVALILIVVGLLGTAAYLGVRHLSAPATGAHSRPSRRRTTRGPGGCGSGSSSTNAPPPRRDVQQTAAGPGSRTSACAWVTASTRKPGRR